MRFLLLALLLVGCDSSRSSSYDSREYDRQQKQKEFLIAKKCGEMPKFEDHKLGDFIVTMRVVGTDVTFPYTATWRSKWEDKHNRFSRPPEFVYRTVVSGSTNTTFHSLEQPKQAKDGLYELFDLRSGERQLVAPSLTISLVRTEEASIDEVSEGLRKQGLEYEAKLREWSKCVDSVE